MDLNLSISIYIISTKFVIHRVTDFMLYNGDVCLATPYAVNISQFICFTLSYVTDLKL